MVIILVQFAIDLNWWQSVSIERYGKTTGSSYQVQHRNFHHALVEVRGAVLDHFDSHHFLRLQILTFNNLTKCPLAENVENKVPIPETMV